MFLSIGLVTGCSVRRWFGRTSVHTALCPFLQRLLRKELKFGREVGSFAPSVVHLVSYLVALVVF